MKVFTFYSYKGGVGRTTMLANIAFNLSQEGYKVGCIDFDIESAGLNAIFETIEYPNATSIQSLLVADGYENIKSMILDGCIKVDTSDETHLFFLPASHSYIETTDATRRFMNDFDSVLQNQKHIVSILKDAFDLDYLFIDSRAGISPMAIPGIVTANELVLVYRLGIQQQVGIMALIKYLIQFHLNSKDIFVDRIHLLGSNVRRSPDAIDHINSFKKWASQMIEKEKRDHGLALDFIHHDPFWRYDFFNDFGSRILDLENDSDQLAIHSIRTLSEKVVLR